MRVLIDGQTLSTPEMRRGIGLVFRRLLEEMVVPEISIGWHIAVRDEHALESLPRQVAEAMEPVVVPPPAGASTPIDACRAYGAAVGEAARALGADWYWNPNPLMPNVHFPSGLAGPRILHTLHDLIPLCFPDWYLNRWPQPLADDYRARLDEIAGRADSLICDSNATREDFRRSFPAARPRLLAAHCGCDYSTMYPLSCGVDLADEPYVLYVGGFDPRKNMERALVAFQRFRRELAGVDRADVRFKIVCAYAEADAAAFREQARRLGIDDSVELLGYVEDEELGALFRGAAVFFFPSLYEGFGLPALDALACGVPVVAGDKSSVPEVCGEHAIYADPYDADALAAALAEAWRRRRQRPGPWIENAAYARRHFDWKQMAAAYVGALKARAEGAPAVHARAVPPIAYVSPWPPQQTGVAHYSHALVRHLAKRRPVVVFTDAGLPAALDGIEVRALEEFASAAPQYPDRVYHIGNNASHKAIYNAAWRHPGVVVVHDFNINPFLVHFFLLGGDPETYKQALLWYGEEGAAAWAAYCKRGAIPDTWKFPMIHPLLARSRGAIVHSRWVARRLSGLVPVHACHLGVSPGTSASLSERSAAREALGLRPDTFHVGAFGFINRHKRIEVIAHAIAKLRGEGFPVVLVLVGKVIDESLDLQRIFADAGLPAEGVLHAGFVSEDEYELYLQAVDVFVNLRFPSMGESSASLFRALARGVPSIVSANAQFNEIPDDVAWKVPVTMHEANVLAEYVSHLLRNPDARACLGSAAYRFVRANASLDRTADSYLKALEALAEEGAYARPATASESADS